MGIINLKSIVVAGVLLFVGNLSAQVSGAKFLLEYDSIKCVYNACVVITSGQTTSAATERAFNSSFSLVVPTGVSVSIESENLYNPTNVSPPFAPYSWEISSAILSPPIQPDDDFYHITTPSLDVIGYTYGTLSTGDTIRLFGITIGDVPNCGEGVRVFNNNFIQGAPGPSPTDPSSADFGGPNHENGFVMGGTGQLYMGKLEDVKPPKPKAPLTTIDCGLPGINIDFYPDTTACKTDFTFSWEGDNGYSGTDEDVTIPTADFSDAGMFTVTITDNQGCKDTLEYYVEPSPDAGPDQTACGGQTVTLNGTVPTSGSWSEDSNNPSGANLGSESNGEIDVTFDANATGDFIFIYDNGGFCADSVLVSLTAGGVVPTAGYNGPLCEGEDLELEGEDISGATYSWLDPSDSEIATTKDHTISNVLTSDAGTYKLIVTTGGCPSQPVEVEVIINELPTVTVIADLDELCAGMDTDITATGGDDYTWDPNVGSNDVVTVSPTSTTLYTVTVEDNNGCTNTDDVEIIVNPLPTATATADPTEICIGESTELTSTGGDFYDWNEGAGSGDIVTVSPTSTTTYEVTVEDNNGCTNTADVEVIVNDLPSILIDANPLEICVGESTDLSASGGVDYDWNEGAGSGDLVTVSPNASTTYEVTVEDNNGCINSADIEVIVNDLPTVDITADPQVICNGNSTELTATGGDFYTWANSVGNSDVVTVSPTTTTTYEVNVEDSNGCENTGDIEVTVNDLPTLTASADPSTICVGESTELTATGGDNYQWSNSAGNTDIVTVSPTSTTTYEVTVEDANGCTNTATIEVVVNDLPVVTTMADPSEICIGESTDLTATGGDTYTWNNSAGASDIVTVNPSITTTYEVEVTDANGCKNTNTIEVTVNPLPTPTATADPATICVGSDAELTATGGVNYTWSDGAGSDAVVTVSPAITTDYIVTVEDANGCENTAEVQVVVNDLPVPTASADPAEICVGSSAMLTATGGVNYVWSESAGNTDIVSVTPIATTTYIVTVEDANGCTNTAEIEVIVNDLPTVSATADPSAICIGESTDLTGTGGDSYVWTNSAGANEIVTVSPTSTTTYEVEATDGNGCKNTAQVEVTVNPLPVASVVADPAIICLGGSTELTAVGGVNYTWNHSSETTNVISVSPVVTTTYITNVEDANGCMNTAEVEVVVNELPTPTIVANPAAICVGGSTTLTAGGGDTYTWEGGIGNTAEVMVSPTMTTTYTVTVIDANICENTIDIEVVVNELPVVTVSATPDEICIGESTDLEATGGDTYTWSGGAGNTDVVTVSPLMTTGFVVTVEDTNGCINTNEIEVTVNPLPTITVTADPMEICVGESTDLTATGGDNYTWNPNVGSTDVVTVNPNTTTTYEVTVEDNNGCINTGSVEVVVNELPTATATADPAEICVGESTLLSATGGVDFIWSNSLGATPDVSVSPTTTTSYSVTVIDDKGCEGTADIEVIVNDLPSIAVTASPDEICIGESTDLEATGGVDFTWNNSAGNSDVVTVFPTETTIYEVTVEDANGCFNTGDIEVTVHELPSVTALASPDEICIGETTDLEAIGGVQFEWNNSAGSSDVVTVSPTSTTLYTVTVEDDNGCFNTADVEVIVNELPTVTTQVGPEEICVGETADLEATGGVNYTWSESAGNDAVVTVSPTNTTMYEVTVEDANGCFNTGEVELIVNDLPTITIQATPNPICIGESADLEATGGINYEWDNGAGSSDVVTVFPIVNTTYSVTVEDANGCENSSSVEVTINDKPTVIITADPSEICIGQATELTATGGVNYNWENGVGTTDVVTVSPTQNMVYVVTVEDANGCENTGEIEVIVNALPTPTATTDPSGICIGDAGLLSATGGENYTWSDNAGNTQDVSVSPISTTLYTVTVEDLNGCENTADVELVVHELPQLTIKASPNPLCIGESADLEATGGENYTWDNGAGNDDVVTVFPIVNTTYTVTVEDVNGCTNTTSIDVVVNPNPIVNVSADPIEICVGESTDLSATGGVDYTWNGGVGTGDNITVTPAVTTSYIVTVEDANGCENTGEIEVIVNELPIATATTDPDGICIGESGQLIATGGTMYTWSGNAGSTAEVTVTPTTTTTYTVTVEDDKGCINSADVELVVHDLPQLTIKATPNPLCIGESADLEATGGDLYTWDNGAGNADVVTVFPTSTTTYTVTVENTNKCINTASVEVVVNDMPDVNATADPEVICIGESTILTATGGANYTWGNSLGNTDVITVSPGVTTTYEVTVEDAQGCTNTASIEVRVNELPSVTVAADPKEICVGESTTIIASGGVNYTWADGQGIADIITVSPNETKTFSVEVEDVNGCKNTAEIEIIVNDLPAVLATTSEDAICIGESVTLTAEGGLDYNWDQTLGNGNVHMVSPISTTTYIVTATDANQCENTASVEVVVNQLPTVEAGSYGPFCVDDAPAILSGTPMNGTFSGTGISGNEFDPSVAKAGTFTLTYTFEDINKCENSSTTEVEVFDVPTLVIGAISCSADLASYMIEVTTDGTLSHNFGDISGEQIINIPAGQDVIIKSSNAAGCEMETTVAAPDCDCDVVDPALTGGDMQICFGEIKPTLEVTTTTGVTADWYDASTGGNLLLKGSLTYTSPENNPGEYIYYAEARNVVDSCTSSIRTKVVFNIKDLPTITNTDLDDEICSGANSMGFVLEASLPGVTFEWSASSTDVSGFTPSGSGNIPSETLNTLSNNQGTLTYTVTPSLNGCPGAPQTFEVNVNPTPEITIDSKNCSTDLLSYIVVFTTDATVTNVTSGTVVGNEITDIAEGTDITITIQNASTNCEAVITVESPQCDCAIVMAPQGVEASSCEGDVNAPVEATVGTNEVIDWYGSASGTDLLISNSSTFTSTEINPGVYTYFAETRNSLDQCVSITRTPVDFTIHPKPTISIDTKECSTDKTSYTLTFSNANVISVSAGTLTNGMITNIAAGSQVTIEFEDQITNCTNSLLVEAPDCSCDVVSAPIGNSATICEGENNPTLSVTVGVNEKAVWYDANSIEVANGPLTYVPTPSAAGVYSYFVEAENTIDGCKSATRTEIVFTINALPSITIDNKECSADKTIYNVIFTGNATVSSDFGTVNGNVIENIAVGQDIVLTITDPNTNCETSLIVEAPDCSCSFVAAPVGTGQDICEDEQVPTLSVTVGTNEIARWYDESNTLVEPSDINYTPSVSGVGVYRYFVEAQNTIDNCISSERVEIVLTIHELPRVIVNTKECSADKTEYSITFTSSANVTSTAGTVNGNVVEGIPEGINVTLTVRDNVTNCVSTLDVTAPDCSCSISNPITDSRVICEEEPNPSLTATFGADEEINWYESLISSTPLVTGSASYTPTDNAIGVHTYYAQARNTVDGCLSDRVPASLTINEKPSIVIDTKECSPDKTSYSVVFTGSGDVVSSAGTVTGNSITNIPAGSDIQVTISNPTNSCARTVDITAPECACSVNPPQVQPLAICEGEPIPTLTALTASSDEITSWYGSETGNDLLQSGSLTYTPTVTNPGQYLYWVESINTIDNCISSTRTQVSLTIHALPTIEVTNKECSADKNNYTITFNSDAAILSNHGQVVGNQIVNIGAGQDVVVTLTSSDNCITTFEVQSPDCNCGLVSNPSATPEIMCEGDNVPTLQVNVGAGETADWYESSSSSTPIMAGSTSYQPNVSLPGVYEYFVEGRNQNDNCISNARTRVTLTVNDSPDMPNPVAISNTICEGELIPTFEVQSVQGVSIDWYDAPIGGNLVQQNSNQFTPNTTNTGVHTYYAQATNTNANCINTARVSVSLTINAAPELTTPLVDQDICSGETIPSQQLNADNNNAIISWSIQNTGVDGVITTSGVGDIPAMTLSSENGGTLIIEVTTSLNGCSGNTERVEYIVGEAVEAGPSLMGVDCYFEGSVNLEAEGSGQWSMGTNNPGSFELSSMTDPQAEVNNFTEPGMYTLVWNVGRCSDNLQIEVGDDCPCNIENNTIVEPFDSTYCGSTGQLLLVGDVALPFGGTYQWQISTNGAPFIPMTGVNNGKDYEVSDLAPGRYQIKRIYRIAGVVECDDDSNIIDIFVHDEDALPNAIELNPEPVCTGDSLLLLLDTDPELSYQWSILSGVGSLGNQTDSSVWVYVEGSGTVSIGVSQFMEGCNDNQLSQNSTVEIAINNSPAPALGLDTTYCELEETRIIDAGEFASYLWQDGSTDRVYEAEVEGLYTVTVTDSLGCVGTDEIEIKSFCCEFDFPNIINLSSSAGNDKFKLTDIYECAIKSELFIFDRWGNLIFKSDEGLDSWDGKFNGEPVVQGVYVFMFNYSALDADDEEFEETISGDVTVIR